MPASKGNGGRNLAIWLGPVVVVAGVVGYYLFFLPWPLLGDVPWLNLVIVAAGVALSVRGLRRSWSRTGTRRLAASVGLIVSLAAGGVFTWYCFVFSYRLPAVALALNVGQHVPQVVLTSHDGRSIDLRQASAARPTVLVFYRGFW